jgi:hypothetical protein
MKYGATARASMRSRTERRIVGEVFIRTGEITVFAWEKQVL